MEKTERIRMRSIVVFLLFIYILVFPPLVIFKLIKEGIWIGSALFFIGCISVWVTSYTAFAGLLYQEGESRRKIPIKYIIYTGIGFIILHFTKVYIHIHEHTINAKVYGIIGIVLGILTAIVVKPSQEEIDNANLGWDFWRSQEENKGDDEN